MKHGFRIAGVLTVVLIVLLSTIPGNMQIRTGAPKGMEHFAAYMLSALILGHAFGSPRRAPFVIGFLVVLAGVLEIFQLWVPGRTFDLRDWEASSLGAMIGGAMSAVHRAGFKNLDIASLFSRRVTAQSFVADPAELTDRNSIDRRFE